RLPLREVPDREQPVPVTGGVLKTLLCRGLLHAPLELALDRARLARQKLDHAIDDLPVRVLVDVADAGCLAALDVVVEARNARVPPRLRPLAGTVLKDPVEHVER